MLHRGGRGKYTLAELPFLFLQPSRGKGKGRYTPALNSFTQMLLDNTDHLGVRSFWLDQWSNWMGNSRRDWVQSTEGRIFQYIFDERAKMTTCTVENATLDLRQVVQDGYWLFVCLPSDMMSPIATTVIGNLIIGGIYHACQQCPPKGHSYRLILDEARFFNTAPLGEIMSMAGGFHLWLTLIVQSVQQLASMSDGRLDPSIIDAAVANARYWTSFQNFTDRELLAKMAFRLTGLVPKSIRRSGDLDYLSAAEELNRHERLFAELIERQVLMFDTLGSFPPRIWYTPEVIMDDVDQHRLNDFEARHLEATGRPASAIREEIEARHRRIRAMIDEVEEKPRRAPTARMGEAL